MLRSIIVAALTAATSVAGTADPASHPARTAMLPRHGVSYTPGIRLWISGSDLRRHGDRVRLYYRTEGDAYVTIFRVNTDGRVQVLFPREPSDENYGYAGATYSVANYDRSSAFLVDDDPGVGYIFGVASSDPFDYDPMIADGTWDLNVVSDGRIHGDPRSAMEEIVGHLLPQGYGEFDTHLLPYYVERRYDYPRFVCYDCHAYTPYLTWDPYQAWCSRFTLTVYSDPFYYYPSYWYPYGYYYGGQRAVYAQPGGSYAGARYTFKNRDAAAPGIAYRDRRLTAPTPASRRSDADVVRGRDIGGVGSVPAPRTPNRRVAPPLSEGGGGGERPREPRTATDDRDPPVSGAGDARRRPENAPPVSGQPAAAPQDGGRRRVDGEPGIEIVPRRGDNGYATPTPARRPEAGYGDEPRPPRPNREGIVRPDVMPRQRSDAELRPPRPEGSRPADTRRSQPPAQPASGQTRGEPPRADAAHPAPREAAPERKPGASPAPAQRAPESRPERAQPSAPPASRPQSSPPPERSHPQASPPSNRDPGLVRRRP